MFSLFVKVGDKVNNFFVVLSSIIWIGLAVLFITLSLRYRQANRTAFSRIFLSVGIAMAVPMVIALADSIWGMLGLKIATVMAVLPALLFPAVLLVAILGVNIWLSSLVADLAEKKGKGWQEYFLLSVFLSPLIIWIVVSSAGITSRDNQDLAQVSPSVQAVSSDLIEKVRKLTELKDLGLITQQEYELKKLELLASL